MIRTYRWLAVALVVAALATTAAAYRLLPDPMPTHFNWQGEADAWGAKSWGAWLLPGGMAGLLSLFWALPWLSPRPFSLEPFAAVFHYIVVCTLAFFFYLHGIFLAVALGYEIPMTRALLAGGLLFLACIGNVLGKVRRNFYVGVRTPWTLANERVWNDTHRFAARLLVAASVVGLVLVWTPLTPIVPGVLVLAALLVPVPYSYFVYRRHERHAAQVGPMS